MSNKSEKKNKSFKFLTRTRTSADFNQCESSILLAKKLANYFSATSNFKMFKVFVDEHKLEFIQDHKIDEREEIYDFILTGKVDNALTCLNSLFPELVAQCDKNKFYFCKQRIIEKIILLYNLDKDQNKKAITLEIVEDINNTLEPFMRDNEVFTNEIENILSHIVYEKMYDSQQIRMDFARYVECIILTRLGTEKNEISSIVEKITTLEEKLNYAQEEKTLMHYINKYTI